MKFKEALKFEKENMPDFQWKFEKFMLAYLAVMLGGALVAFTVAMIIGCVSGEDGGLWYIPLIVWGCALAGMTVALVIKTKKVKPRLRRYHVDKLSREFYEIDYPEARQKMIESEKITEEGFLATFDDGKTEIIPFDKVKIVFNPYSWAGKLFFEIMLIDEKGVMFVGNMDNDYYNFLIRHADLIRNKPLFEMFDKDREKFIALLLRYNNASKIEEKLRG